MEKRLNEIKNKVLLSLPAPKDFITLQRYVRKKSMIVGWMYVAMIILAIICAAGTWTKQYTVERTSLGARGTIVTTTVGEYTLTRYHLDITIEVSNSTPTKAVEEGSLALLPGSKNLWPCSQYVLANLIILIFLYIVQWYATLCHSWSKFDDRRTYLFTSLVSLAFTLMKVTCFVAYLACKPRLTKGCVLSWAGWLFFILMICQAVLMAFHFMDKPKGLIRYGKGGVLIFEKIEDEEEEEDAGTGNDGKKSRRTSTHKPGLTYNLLTGKQLKDDDLNEEGENNNNREQKEIKKGYNHPPPQLPPRSTDNNTTKLNNNNNLSNSNVNSNVAKRKVPPPPLPKRAPQKNEVKALYDCVGESSGELSFNRGDVLTFVSDNPGNGWITCELNGTKGIVPANYVSKE